MDIFDAIRIIAKWWFVSLPVFLLTLAVSLIATTTIAPEYTAGGSMLLVGPNVVSSADGASSEQVNPLLTQPGALPTSALVIALSANTPQVAELLQAEGYSTDYEVVAQGGTPILYLTTRASSRSKATETALRVVELIDEDLRIRQDAAGAPADARVSTVVIGLSSVGGADYNSRTRARVALLVLGTAGAFATAFLLEGLSRRRRRDDHTRNGSAAADPDAEVDGAEPARRSVRPR